MAEYSFHLLLIESQLRYNFGVIKILSVYTPTYIFEEKCINVYKHFVDIKIKKDQNKFLGKKGV